MLNLSGEKNGGPYLLDCFLQITPYISSFLQNQAETNIFSPVFFKLNDTFIRLNLKKYFPAFCQVF